MKAEIWELNLSYTILDEFLGLNKIVKELYIPVLNYSFNFTYDNVNVINNTNNDRYKNSSTCYLCQIVKSKLVKIIELDVKQVQLYQELIKKSQQLNINNFETDNL
jgi:hypothetical protein